MYESLISQEQRILERIIRGGAQYCDMRYQSVNGTGLELKNDELREVIPGRIEGAIIRALYKGSWGIYSFNDLENMKIASEMVLALAASPGKGDVRFAELEPVKDTVIWKPEIPPEDIPLREKYQLLMDMHKEVQPKDGIIGITSVYSDARIRKRFVSSEGTEIEMEQCRCHVQSLITARSEGRILGYRTRVGATGGFEIFRNDDPIEKAVEGAENALRILGARSSPSGRMNVICDNDLTGVFAHEAVGHGTEGDLVVAGESILRGKLGTKIGSDLVTLIDDPTIPGGFGSFPYDDEGTPGQRKILIQHGILNDYILNRETAGRLELVPNGGARAQGYSSKPLVRMSNTMILNGDSTLEEMLEDIKLGVYAKGTRGGQVDTVRGSFQFSAQQAFLIENGEITVPLRDVSLSGMTLETLMNIDAVGNDAKLGDPGFCGKGQMVPVGDGGPHIRIRNAVVGGSA